MRAVVIQSYRQDRVPEWIGRAMRTVRAWADRVGADYRFVGDEIFDRVPAWYLEKAGRYKQIATDYGRLVLLREALAGGYGLAVWLDADVVVFDGANFPLPDIPSHAFGRELWVQPGPRGGLKVHRNVHNAFCAFAAGNPMLDFYADSCLRIMDRVSGGVPPQIVGTKFLTALHNIVGLPLVDEVGMLSPLCVEAVARGGGAAVEKLRAELSAPMRAANLCASLAGTETDGVELDEATMTAAVEILVESRGAVVATSG